MKQREEDMPLGDWDDSELIAFQGALIDVLKHPEKYEEEREKMKEWARTQSWLNVAKEWGNDFSV